MFKNIFAFLFRRTTAAYGMQGIILGGLLALIMPNQVHPAAGLFTLVPARTTGIVQGIIVGAVLAYLTANLLMNARFRAATTTVNGWSITMKCGQPGNGLLLRAACARILPATNLVEEAAYWTTTVDGTGGTLSGRHNYVMHFPAGQLPPAEAFWSLTMTDVVGYMVSNPIGRYSLGSRSGFEPNADGSTDIYIQATAPAGHESNWLPAPAGNFKLTLRAYLPGRSILDGEYHLPPVNKVE